jgi:glycosyltransferase involved in cell wall biosynthesis
MPSLADEWGMVVNEAMATGLPVLGSTGCVAVEEMVAEGESGWKYAPGDADGLAEALDKLLSRSRNELRAMGDKARAVAFLNSDEHVAEMILKAVRDVGCQHPE